jgi:hypothetical protein
MRYQREPAEAVEESGNRFNEPGSESTDQVSF